MKVYTLKYKQVINENLDTVFDFFSNPENLSIITPLKLDFCILTPCPIEMKESQLIDYTIKIIGKKIRWRTIITKYDPPNLFVDQQLKGPYSMWHHLHEFKTIDEGVEITDTINYVMPFGFLGKLVNFLWVKNDLKKIFEYRKEAIHKHFKYKGK